MIKAIASKLRIDNNSEPLAKEFLGYIENLLSSKEVQKLSNFYQHCNTNRLQHSINVSYYSFLWAKKLNLDAKCCARAGLLHDFFLYNQHTDKFDEHHLFYHPKVAYENAKKVTSLTEVEKDAILKHMFPLCKGLPSHRESYIVTFADKYCSILEVSFQLSSRLFPRKIKYILNNKSKI